MPQEPADQPITQDPAETGEKTGQPQYRDPGVMVVYDATGRANFLVSDGSGNDVMHGTEASARESIHALGIEWPGEGVQPAEATTPSGATDPEAVQPAPETLPPTKTPPGSQDAASR